MSKRIELRRCQERARDKIVDAAVMCLNDRDYEHEYIFGLVAPTGSGKTVILGKSIKKIAQELNRQVAFIWLSIAKGDLANQSIAKLKGNEDFFGLLNQSGLSVIGVEDIKGLKTLTGNVLVIGWDSLNKTDKEGNPINISMREGDFQSFPELCQATRDINVPIVLIIDESHTYAFTDKSLDIRNNFIKPAFTIEVTATPKKTNQWREHHTITYAEAQRSGLIKNDVRCTTFLSSEDGLRLGADKLQSMIKLAEKSDAGYNPRLLVFMPNADNTNGGDELDNSLKFFKDNYGWTEESGEVVVWLSKRKSKDHEQCKNNHSNCKVILTKEAIDTGVDIPAIQVIVQLRPVSTAQVQVQKIGRGLRMPYQHHYENELDKLNFYVFNDAFLDFSDMEGIKDQVNRKYSVIRPELLKDIVSFPQLRLSFYTRKSPLREFEDKEFRSVFTPIFERKLSGFTGYDMATDYIEETKSGSVNLDDKKAEFDTFDPSAIKEDHTLSVYTARMRTNLKHMHKHLECIEDCIGNLLESKDQYESITRQQIFTLNNMTELMRMVFESLDEGEEQVGKHKERVEKDYTIPPEYFIDADVDSTYKKHLHDKYFITRSGRSQIESAFEKMLEEDDRVVWWQRNYDCQIGKSYSVCYSDESSDNVFYPDYIVSLKNGKFLIVDTKEGTGDIHEGKKRDALVEALKDQPNVIGGIVKRENGRPHFYIQHDNNKPELLTDFF